MAFGESPVEGVGVSGGTGESGRNFWRGKRVFLTGHTGFKGSWLSLWLSSMGAMVSGYALSPPTDPSLYALAGVDSLVSSILADVRDAGMLARSLADARPDEQARVARVVTREGGLEFWGGSFIADPFGRRATFTYSPEGQLATITDVMGLTSSFAYGPNDFVASLTTPYGTTTFRHEPSDPANYPWIEATDPTGGTERTEYRISTTAVPATVPPEEVPSGFGPWNTNLDRYVTVEWDSAAWAAGPGDISQATVTRWFLKQWSTYAALRTVPAPQSLKRPLERRVWYAYPGQDREHPEDELGWLDQPSVVARVLDDGTTLARCAGAWAWSPASAEARSPGTSWPAPGTWSTSP